MVVPISVIKRQYPGGWAACLEEHEGLLGGRVLYDDHLFCDGAMNPRDMESLVKHWESLGFQAFEVRDGHKLWKDLCVVESLFGGATLQCDWIVVDNTARIAHLKGTDPGRIVRPWA